MVSGRLKEWAVKKGWTIKDGLAYGEVWGYLLTAFDGMGFKAFGVLLPELDEQTRWGLNEYFKENKKELKLRAHVLQGRVLVLQLMEQYRSASLEEMDKLVEALVVELRKRGVPQQGQCIFCGQAGAAETVIVGGLATMAHENCFAQASSEIERAKLEKAYEPKNYGMGLIGALLGSMVAAIPWILVQAYGQFVASILGYLIGVGAKIGYNLFKGKTGALTRWIVLGSAVVTVVAAELVITLLVARKMGLPIGFETLILLLRVPEFLTAFLKDLGLSMFMALLGLWSVFSQLRQQEKSMAPEVKRA